MPLISSLTFKRGSVAEEFEFEVSSEGRIGVIDCDPNLSGMSPEKLFDHNLR